MADVVQFIGGGSKLPMTPQSPHPALPQMAPSIAAEGWKLYDKLVDADVMYLNKLARLLYSVQFIRTGTIDMQSPIPGYTMVDLADRDQEGNKIIKRNMNFQGFTTTTNLVLMAVSEAVSSSAVDPKDYNLNEASKEETMSIIDLMCASREKWELKDANLIVPIGFQIWKNIYFISHRSMIKAGRQTMLDKLMHPAIFGVPSANDESKKPKVKLLDI